MRDGCRGRLAKTCLLVTIFTCLTITTQFYFSHTSSVRKLTSNLSQFNAISWVSQTLISDSIRLDHRNISFNVGTELIRESQIPQTATDEDPYIYNGSRICDYSGNLQFVVLVHSSTENFDKREAIRDTWANVHLFHNVTMRVVFLLGKPRKRSTQVLIDLENLHYNDIVQGDFHDTYHNLTLKAVMGLRWVSEFCDGVRAVVKVDDDVFANVFRIFDIVMNEKHKDDRTIICTRWLGGETPIAREGKWKTDEFSDLKYYPMDYCGGFFIIIPGGLVPELYEASKRTPFFWIDDVYFSGMLTHQIGNVTFTNLKDYTFSTDVSVKCFTAEGQCTHVATVIDDYRYFEILWLGLTHQYRELANQFVDPRILELWLNVYLKTPVIVNDSSPQDGCRALSCMACIIIILLLVCLLLVSTRRYIIYRRYNAFTSMASIIRV